jgi:RNA methyltransferase, TrmH family
MLGKIKTKYIQSLYQKKNRDAEGLFIAEGPKIVNEVLTAAPALLNAVYALPEWLDMHPQAKPVTTVITAAELEKISQQQAPNQVLAVVKQFAARPLPDARLQPVLALDGIQDPGNLGTLIRIADWFGVPHIVCGEGCADLYNPKVVQATMGSLLRVAVHYTRLDAYLQNQKGMPVYAAVLNGEPLPNSPGFDKGILLIGNESKGISTGLLPLVTKRVSIPGRGGAESLNAAVAAGIILSHLMG